MDYKFFFRAVINRALLFIYFFRKFVKYSEDLLRLSAFHVFKRKTTLMVMKYEKGDDGLALLSHRESLSVKM